MERSSELRAADEQRERLAQQLRDHFAAGRDHRGRARQRVQQAYAAQTEQQLDRQGDRDSRRRELRDRRGYRERDRRG